MKKSFVFVLLLALVVKGLAQEQPKEEPKKEPKKEIEELRLKLNDEGSHYIKATFLNQVWLRYADYNPGTTVLGNPTSNGFDIGLRRTRFQLFGQLTDHVAFYFQIGQNNFNYLAGQNNTNTGNRKVQIFMHDALGEYKVKKGSDILYLGGGLTITNGLSRFSQPSIGTIMSMDVPVFAQATVDQTDEFSRKLSIYARGQLGRLDYRIIMSDPFPVTSSGLLYGTTTIAGTTVVTPVNTKITSPNSTFAFDQHHKQYQGFFMWNFFDKESHTTPYMTGTYLGKKKILNLEAGFITQKAATASSNDGGATVDYHDMNLLSVAIFYDAPMNMEKGTAFNAYAGYFHSDYGTRYLRYNGIMNPANGTTTPGAPAGSYGNAFPMFGTGNVFYAQAGYLLKKDLLGEGNGTLMPYVTVMSANYDRLDKTMNVYDVGMNWFIKGHTSKFTLDYQIRPTYTPVGTDLIHDSGTQGQVVLQYQFYF